MSRSILVLARYVLDAFATRPLVVVPAIAVCATELLGIQSVRAQLPQLSGNETAQTAEDDRGCDGNDQTVPPSDSEPCDRSESEASSPPEGIPPPMFGYSPSPSFTPSPSVPPREVQPPQTPAPTPVALPPRQVQPQTPAPTPVALPPRQVQPQTPAPTPVALPPRQVQPQTPAPTPVALPPRQVQPQTPVNPSVAQSDPRTPSPTSSTSTFLESAPPPLFAPPDSASALGYSPIPREGQPPVVATDSRRLPLLVPTLPPSSEAESSTVVPTPPPSLPTLNPSSTLPGLPSAAPPKALGCGTDDRCGVPQAEAQLQAAVRGRTDDIVATIPAQFSFEENAGQAQDAAELSQVGDLALVYPPSSLGREALTEPEYRFQGAYIYQGDEASARARISGFYPLSPTLALGGSFDVTDGTAFADSQTQGAGINELYLVASFPELPNLRFALGQLDLTSYFDRNSFAKDGATHFFNSVFQTNPALSRTGIGSRTSLLMNLSVTDDVEVKLAGFSSARRLEEFQIDGLAAELGVRHGNLIVRGTFATDRDGGVDDGVREIFQLDRGDGGTGLLSDDREQAYGVNAEVFVPEIGLGLFGRYGRYENLDADVGGDSYSVGMNVLDLFVPRDRFGIAYGQDLSNHSLRRQNGDELPDVFEAFYDFALLPNVRLGFSFQSLNEFSDNILGVRMKTEFDMTPLQRYP